MKYNVDLGDIFSYEVDAIVIPANCRPCERGGLDRIAYKKAGYENMLNAREKIGDIDIGESAITDGFNLKAKKVIHTVTPKFTHENSIELLKKCYISAMNLAIDNNIKTMAFPLLGAGKMRFSICLAKEIAENTINEFSKKSSLEEVKLVLKYKEPNDIVKKILKEAEFKKVHSKNEMRKYLKKYKKTQSDIAIATDIDSAQLSRMLSNDKRFDIQKAIKIALYLELPPEEFIDFIVCSGNSFPCNEFECEIIEDAINGKYDLYAFMEKTGDTKKDEVIDKSDR